MQFMDLSHNGEGWKLPISPDSSRGNRAPQIHCFRRPVLEVGNDVHGRSCVARDQSTSPGEASCCNCTCNQGHQSKGLCTKKRQTGKPEIAGVVNCY